MKKDESDNDHQRRAVQRLRALCLCLYLKIMEINKGATNQKGYHPAHNIAIEKCIACGNCAVTCPDAAIALEKE